MATKSVKGSEVDIGNSDDTIRTKKTVPAKKPVVKKVVRKSATATSTSKVPELQNIKKEQPEASRARKKVKVTINGEPAMTSKELAKAIGLGIGRVIQGLHDYDLLKRKYAVRVKGRYFFSKKAIDVFKERKGMKGRPLTAKKTPKPSPVSQTPIKKTVKKTSAKLPPKPVVTLAKGAEKTIAKKKPVAKKTME